MKRQGDQGNFLELGRRGTPALKTKEMTSGRFKPGDKVRLTSSEYLHGAYGLMGQRFPEGEIGKIIGQADGECVVVRFKKEDWEVEESKLALVTAPVKKKARPKSKRA